VRSLGSLRHRVQLQSQTNTTDTGGGIAQVWTTIANVYCSIAPKTGSESYRQGQIQDKTTHEIAMRYRASIDTKYRIKYGTRLFNINHIKNIDERNRYLLLTCEEGVAV
tara:strand:+ start:447 stop:773 length:327 start_codon:yes stop_codon:yes gene_type:complete